MTAVDVRCLVTGSTGYIGSRLIPRLLDRGHRVRALARTPEKLADVPWRDDVEVARGDLTDPETLVAAFDGVDVVYYLAHAMGTSDDFVEAESRAANNVVAAARTAGVRRIVYLSGLHPEGVQLSKHLQSRTKVGEILIDSGIETIVLQAGVVIGSGSASFEMVRHLTDRLPVMTTPKWVHNRIQPIAINDVLHYLAEAATTPVEESRAWDIGGPDVLEYGDMMQVYAEVAGLRRRRILVLPFLTPTIASWWVGLVTPIPAGLARPLVESLHCDAVANEHDIDGVIPPPPGGATRYRDAVTEALARLADGQFEANWDSDPAAALPSDPDWSGELVYSQTVSTRIALDTESARLRLRGLRMNRWAADDRSKSALRLHDWGRFPGDAWCDVEIAANGAGSVVAQRTSLRPHGLFGQLYAATLWPIRRKLLNRKLSRVLAAG